MSRWSCWLTCQQGSPCSAGTPCSSSPVRQETLLLANSSVTCVKTGHLEAQEANSLPWGSLAELRAPFGSYSEVDVMHVHINSGCAAAFWRFLISHLFPSLLHVLQVSLVTFLHCLIYPVSTSVLLFLICIQGKSNARLWMKMLNIACACVCMKCQEITFLPQLFWAEDWLLRTRTARQAGPDPGDLRPRTRTRNAAG